MKIPKQETVLLAYVFKGIDCYIVTRNALEKYILYKILDGDYQKLKTAESPLEFDEIVKKDRSK
jgi:hypothetical protein